MTVAVVIAGAIAFVSAIDAARDVKLRELDLQARREQAEREAEVRREVLSGQPKQLFGGEDLDADGVPGEH